MVERVSDKDEVGGSIPPMPTKYMIYIYIIISIVAFSFILVSIYVAFIGGSSYASIPQEKIQKMIKNLELKQDSKIVDLGSGDGRVVIELARAGYNAIGYEINPYLVYYSRLLLFLKGLTNKSISNNSKIYLKNYFNEDLSYAEGVFLFVSPIMFVKILEKLKKDLKKGTTIISFSSKMPGLKIEKIIDHNIFFYKI